MTDGIAWLAEPQSIAFGGYSVVLARGVEPEELVARIVEGLPGCTARPLGELTAEALVEEYELDFAGDVEDIALHHGRTGDLAFVVAYGYWQGELSVPPSASRGGAEVYHLEFEEENGKPVPPFFHGYRDGRSTCFLNLHLDGSWGPDGVDGEPSTVAALTAELAAVGLPDHDRAGEDLHRTCLEVLGRHFGLTLPRALVRESALPAVLLEV